MSENVKTDILYPALRLARVVEGAQHGPSTAHLADAFQSLNRFLGRLNTSGLNLFTVAADLYTLTPQKQKYSIGSDPAGVLTPDLVGARPQKITAANILFQTSPVIRRPIKILDDAEWADKRLQQIYSIPLEMYPDGASPLSTLYFYPIPDSAYRLELYTWQRLARFAAQTDILTLPEGYTDMFVNNLAVRLAAQFGKPINPLVLSDARASLAEIQSLNCGAGPLLGTEPGIGGAGGGYYNYLTGLDD